MINEPEVQKLCQTFVNFVEFAFLHRSKFRSNTREFVN